MNIRLRNHSPALLLLGLGLSGIGYARVLGGESSEENPPPSYADVAPIVESNCTPCHNSGYASGGVSLETAEEIILQRDQVEAAVSSGYMPYGQPEWKDSPDGVLFLAWLKAQPR